MSLAFIIAFAFTFAFLAIVDVPEIHGVVAVLVVRVPGFYCSPFFLVLK